jgi:GxxExxY protein
MDTKGTKDTKAFMNPNAASRAVIGCAMKVHTALGAGVLESTVCACLKHEFSQAGMHVQRDVAVPVVYEGVRLPAGYRVDFIIEKCLVLEVKCVERVLPVHLAQLMSYLKVTALKLGLLINFKVAHLRNAIYRRINGSESDL